MNAAPAAGGLWTLPLEDLNLLGIELAIVAGAALLLLVSLVIGARPNVATGLALTACAAAVWLGTGLWARAETPRGLAAPGAEGVLLLDRFGLALRILFCGLLFVVILGWRLLADFAPRRSVEFLVLLLCSAAGLLVMVSTSDLLVLLIAIELASLPSYVLSGFGQSRRESEAALKFAIFGAAATGVMIFAASLLFGLAGTLHLPELGRQLAIVVGDAPVLCGALLLVLLVGVGFKISAVPVHFWCPDVFSSAPLAVVLWLSVASKLAGVAVLLRIVEWLAAAEVPRGWLDGVQLGIGAIGALTCTWANIAALHQVEMRRLLAYSSIAHAGYLMLAAAAVLSGAGDVARSAVIFYAVVYALLNCGAFLSAGVVAAALGDERVAGFRGLGARAPALAVSTTICLVGLIGLPPTGGFLSKWWLIFSLGQGGQITPLLWGLAGVVVLNTVLSLWYYARPMREMWLAAGDTAAWRGDARVAGLVHLSALGVLLTGTLCAGTLKRLADAAAG